MYIPQGLLNRFDKNKDGKLSKDEVPDQMLANFTRVDTNKDGSIDAAELAQWILHDPPAAGGPVRMQSQLHKLIWDPRTQGV